MEMQPKFRTARRAGYEFAEVDQFVEWVATELRSAETIPRDVLDKQRFRMARTQGYEVRDVDSWIDDLPVPDADGNPVPYVPLSQRSKPAEQSQPSNRTPTADGKVRFPRWPVYVALAVGLFLLSLVLKGWLSG